MNYVKIDWIDFTHDNLDEVFEFVNGRYGRNVLYNGYQAKTPRGKSRFYTRAVFPVFEPEDVKIVEGVRLGVAYLTNEHTPYILLVSNDLCREDM